MVGNPVLLSNGRQIAGSGGIGYAGGLDGMEGCIVIDPPETMDLSGEETRVQGGNVRIFGGPGWLLDLRDLNGEAIVASGKLTLGVGSGGTVDLRQNQTPIITVGGPIVVASDSILLDSGISLDDLINTTGSIDIGPAETFYDVSAEGPGQTTGEPGATIAVDVTMFNNGRGYLHADHLESNRLERHRAK